MTPGGPREGPGELTTARVRELRPAKAAPDPWQPLGTQWEEERQADGRLAPVLTVFLAGAECPFTCVFCDLWQHTLDGPTPPGALPAQLAGALDQAGPLPPGAQVKLYNASNFFDPRAVPPEDDPALAEALQPFSQVVVENHPRLVGRRTFDFAAGLAGRLQVAMGLETVHPTALPRLGKGMTLEDFARAAAELGAAGIGVRAFVLLAPPFVPADEAALWAERSAAWAFERGVEHVSLVPVRGGNGALEVLAARGERHPPGAGVVEEAFERCLGLGGGVVTLDTWDLERHLSCRRCRTARRHRLERMNRSGRTEPPVACEACG